MVDKITFMETLRSVQEIVRTSAQPMSKTEIQTYFKEMDLSEEQQEMIYQYLLQHKEEPAEEAKKESEDFSQTEDRSEMDDSRQEISGSGEDTEDSRKDTGGSSTGSKRKSPYFQMYLDEIRQIPAASGEEKVQLYERLLAGEEAVIADISNQWLQKITELAENYATEKVLIEDLVQEGNIGLLLGAQQLLGAGESIGEEELYETAAHRLELFVREAMENYRQGMEGEDNSEHTILAKVSLVHEARKALAEETGSTPSLQQLSDYTKIPVEEITDILALPREIG